MLAITQADHARLSGAIARVWGNEKAWRPEPWEPLVAAAARHDDGWIEWDARPTVDSAGSPHDFITVSLAERIEIYRRGVEVVRNEDPHTQVLVSMHLSGLFLGRLEPGAPKLVDFLEGGDRRLVEEFIAEQKVWGEEAPEGMTGATQLAQYRLLQVFDQLSLVLCLNPPERPSDTTLSFVPLSEPGADLEPMRVSAEGGRATLAPYPLGTEPVEVAVLGKMLSSQDFPDVDSYPRALAEAPIEELRFRLEGG